MLTETFADLVRVEIDVWNALDARLRADHDLTYGRFQVMQVLADRTADGGTCRVHDIADVLAVTVGGISKLVDRVEAAGHCVRRPNPDDRRSSLLDLTAGGRELLAAATEGVEGELARRFGALSARELEQFSAVLAKVRAS